MKSFSKKKKWLNIKYVFWYSLQSLSEKFLVLRRILRDVINAHRSSCKYTLVLSDSMTLLFTQCIRACRYDSHNNIDHFLNQPQLVGLYIGYFLFFFSVRKENFVTQLSDSPFSLVLSGLWYSRTGHYPGPVQMRSVVNRVALGRSSS